MPIVVVVWTLLVQLAVWLGICASNGPNHDPSTLTPRAARHSCIVLTLCLRKGGYSEAIEVFTLRVLRTCVCRYLEVANLLGAVQVQIQLEPWTNFLPPERPNSAPCVYSQVIYMALDVTRKILSPRQGIYLPT
ncbi:hypothetical protein F4801DRAFT_9931 [Xylaria longipes]|nr:hypothetical protein F4801DRAFT_9931 [Xylaria longipes]